MRLGSLLLACALAFAMPAGAQEHAADSHAARADSAALAPSGTEVVNAEAHQSLTGEPSAAGHAAEGAEAHPDIIMPHITDAYHMELPCINREWGCKVRTWPASMSPLKIGSLDITPTKHTWMLLLAAVLCAVVLITTAQAHRRHHHAVGRPRGFANGMEAVVLYVRNEVILKNVGPHGEGFVPYLLTVFFFILFANALGLLPYMSTATGNISVTATLAVMSFILIEIAGMRALGKEYWGTIFYWPHGEPLSFMKIVLFIILTPVELLGKFTKPFALAIRLFANMTAGHVIVLAFIGIIFTFHNYLIGLAPLSMAVGIMLLEVLVALIQAYIFTLLTSVFIGQIRSAHH